MNDLTEQEQTHVRTALRFLRLRIGAWAPLAKALHFANDTIEKVVNGRRPVTAAMAFRVARFVGATVDDLLAGRFLPPGTCPHCGHPPESSEDERAA